jgi:hypothetical protein
MSTKTTLGPETGFEENENLAGSPNFRRTRTGLPDRMKHMCEMGVTRGPVDVTGRSGAQSAMTLTPNVGILWVTLSTLDRVLQDV